MGHRLIRRIQPTETHKLQCHGLVDQHYGDAVTDEVGPFLILAHEQRFEIRRHLAALEIFQNPFAGLLQEPVDQRFIRQADRLEGLWATEDGEQFRKDPARGAHRVEPGEAYFFFLRSGRPVRSFSVTS